MTDDLPDHPPAAVLAALDLDPAATTEQIAAHGRATTWRVDGFALRGSASCDPAVGEAIASLLDLLVDAGVGVPAPRRTAGGEAVVVRDGLTWTVTAWVDGSPVDADDRAVAHALGALLARAHLASEPLVDGWPRRDGLPPLTDLADAPRVDDWSLRAAMVRLGQPLPGHVVHVADLMRRVQLHLAPFQRHVDDHPAVVHFDAHPGNVRTREDGTLVLLDWELAHVDGRAVDVAVAQRTWPDGAGSLLEGYCTVTALTDEEVEALPLLAAARGLDHIATRISRWAADPRATSLDEVAAAVDAELPDLDERLAAYPDVRSGRPPRGRG